MRPTDLPDTIDLAFDKTALPDDVRREPPLAFAPWPADLDDEPDEVAPLDPSRVDFDPEPPPPTRRPTRGPIGSLILHLLPLLLLITWPRTPIEMPAPIPVQLVIEQPPPPPPPPPPERKQSAKPPPGRIASDDFAETQGPKSEKGAGEAPPSAGAPPPPAGETPTAAPAAPAPKPLPPTEASNEEPRPPPTEIQTAEVPPPPKPAPPPPKPKPPKEQATMRMPQPLGDAWPLPLQPNETRRTAARIGPTATRDEYCAYALNLTLRHIDLLPNALIGARRGQTVLSIRVLEDGTIQNVMVAQSSGYPDIDERVEQMVHAVGRFPPLPRWVPGRYMDFTFQLHFPR